MVSSILRITSQVEHTKKCNDNDSESKSEMKCQSSESINSVFLHVTLILPYSKKTFLAWTKCYDAKRWLTKYVWLFQSIGGLQQLFCRCFASKCCQKYKFYRRKEYQKSNAMHITAVMSSTLWWPLYPLLSYYSTLYRLEVMSRCCNNLPYIFVHTYFHCQASKEK